MKSKNEYIGDDKFKKFLDHYDCRIPLEVIKFRFAGAICSPNLDLRPTDVISSLWPTGQSPRLETKNEADLFFKFFMGLWDEMFYLIADNNLTFPHFSPKDDLRSICSLRYNMLENGFIEGFWGGQDNIKIPTFIAEIIDSLSTIAKLYQSLTTKIKSGSDNQAIVSAITECDKTINKSVRFIIQNFVLPRMEELKRTVN